MRRSSIRIEEKIRNRRGETESGEGEKIKIKGGEAV